jgi:hypothetical protein
MRPHVGSRDMYTCHANVMQMAGLSALDCFRENKFHNLILLVFLRYKILFVNVATLVHTCLPLVNYRQSINTEIEVYFLLVCNSS